MITSPRNANFGHISVNKKHNHESVLCWPKVYNQSYIFDVCLWKCIGHDIIYAVTINSNIGDLYCFDSYTIYKFM